MAIFTLKLIERKPIAFQTMMFTFEKPEALTFKPGQYGGFTLMGRSDIDPSNCTRRFSILSAPDDQTLSIATRMQPSAYKEALNHLAIGQTIKFAGPTGNFTLHDDPQIPAVFIAGGIGIVPFYAMIKHAINHQTPPLTLLFGNRSLDEAPFLNELSHWQKIHRHFQLYPILEQVSPDWQGATGLITDAFIRAYVPDIFSPIYYICGSPAMVTIIQERLAELEIDEDRIKTEDFPGY